jgi:protein required for attachment to host cells
MQLPHGAIVAVADGEKLNLFRNDGDEARLNLGPAPTLNFVTTNTGSGVHHQSNSSNPDEGQQQEDNFSGGVVEALNREVLEGRITSLVIIAAPRSLGEFRKHYHKSLSAILVGEIHKDLTGHSTADVEHAISSN